MRATNRQHAVIIGGGGPTGLMLAAELALAGVDVAIVERRPSQQLAGARAGGLHARTIEVFDQRGIAGRFLAEGQKHQIGFSYRHTTLDISTLPSRHNYFIGLWQNKIERILAEWVSELAVPIYKGDEVAHFTQGEAVVDITLASGDAMHAQYLVGCDGGRSTIRKAAGIDFAGWDPTKSWLIAEVHFTEEPPWGFHEDATGTHAIGKMEEAKTMRFVLTENELKTGREPTLDDVRRTLTTVYGTDFGAHSPISISRFTDVTRQAATYRKGRVLLAGDAAHVHPPMGGQGLNIGVQDAVNLGWKLAQVVKGVSPESLLDTYHSERHPVAARVLRNTMAHVALQRTDERTRALGDVIAELLESDEARKRQAIENSGIGTRYDLGEGHPLLGRRMPDLDLMTADGPANVFWLLHKAKGVLLNFSPPGSFKIAAWAGRVQCIDVKYDGTWEVPLVGTVPSPIALLVRPDGYVAWAGENGEPGLTEALTKWFGPAAEA